MLGLDASRSTALAALALDKQVPGGVWCNSEPSWVIDLSNFLREEPLGPTLTLLLDAISAFERGRYRDLPDVALVADNSLRGLLLHADLEAYDAAVESGFVLSVPNADPAMIGLARDTPAFIISGDRFRVEIAKDPSLLESLYVCSVKRGKTWTLAEFPLRMPSPHSFYQSVASKSLRRRLTSAVYNDWGTYPAHCATCAPVGGPRLKLPPVTFGTIAYCPVCWAGRQPNVDDTTGRVVFDRSRPLAGGWVLNFFDVRGRSIVDGSSLVDCKDLGCVSIAGGESVIIGRNNVPNTGVYGPADPHDPHESNTEFCSSAAASVISSRHLTVSAVLPAGHSRNENATIKVQHIGRNSSMLLRWNVKQQRYLAPMEMAKDETYALDKRDLVVLHNAMAVMPTLHGAAASRVIAPEGPATARDVQRAEPGETIIVADLAGGEHGR